MAQKEILGHEHPLTLLNGDEQSKKFEKAGICFGCGKKVLLSTPRYNCLKCGDFFLHKLCAEAPLEINHPFHLDHPLVLDLQKLPYQWECNFCLGFGGGLGSGGRLGFGDRFVYHCSCGLTLHIKCALFTYYMAQSKLKELEDVELQDLYIPVTRNTNPIFGPSFSGCLVCRKPLSNSVYIFGGHGRPLYVHKECVDLPLKINHMCHREHPLLKQFFISKSLSCKVCQNSMFGRLAYCCLHCEFALDIQCLSPSPPPIIEHKSHQHPFTLFWRRAPFICDACGFEGNRVAYVCCTCKIIVHEKCTSLPRRIKSRWHDDHCLSQAYFLEDEKFKNQDCICIVCLDEVNTDLGSYSCSHCQIFAHANCATKHDDWYSEVENEDDDKSRDNLALSPITVIETNDAGEATKIKHFKHIHNLMLGSVEMEEYDTKCCDGCILPISPPYFSCTECHFSLHKVCAELPKKKRVWLHECQELLTITSDSDQIFECKICQHHSTGFGYNCDRCKNLVCFKCVTTLTQRPVNFTGHPHPLSFYLDYEGQCHGCEEDISRWAYYCKKCKFALGPKCLTLPTRVQHKCDEKHHLALTYSDDNDYSATHYCDICEERRDPSHWFYHCATCDTSAHVKCALGDFPFIKVGSILDFGIGAAGTFVKKIYYYPKCIKCDQPMTDLALEWVGPSSSSLVHMKCLAS
ncbi:DC1 domain-containing protein [Corchorus olitorius]|uniref:DC1 domain-containing protein n=1 Tax=Corchorus olitorius TaxID=93759 RepID=A0A1R3JDR8_9ROSI|nr:DC1 domain-containing protein [Corchorus olitorius]